jgi:hypothetical protein
MQWPRSNCIAPPLFYLPHPLTARPSHLLSLFNILTLNRSAPTRCPRRASTVRASPPTYPRASFARHAARTHHPSTLESARACYPHGRELLVARNNGPPKLGGAWFVIHRLAAASACWSPQPAHPTRHRRAYRYTPMPAREGGARVPAEPLKIQSMHHSDAH